MGMSGSRLCAVDVDVDVVVNDDEEEDGDADESVFKVDNGGKLDVDKIDEAVVDADLVVDVDVVCLFVEVEIV